MSEGNPTVGTMADSQNAAIQVMGSPSPGALIQVALERGLDVETLERLMALKERHEANEARKAYVAAMAAFKANPPKIVKDRQVRTKLKTGGVMEYRHASLANVVDAVSAGLGEHGLSAAWATEQEGRLVKVMCTITHEMGHVEKVSLSAPPDDSGLKNPIQQVGSTVTYLQRYTLMAAVGLAAADMDDVDQRKAQKQGRPYVEPEKAKGDFAPEETVNAFARFGVVKDDLERFTGTPLAYWGTEERSALAKAWKQLDGTPPDKLKDRKSVV